MGDVIELIRRLSDIEAAQEATARAVSAQYGRAVTTRLARLAEREEISLPDIVGDGERVLQRVGTRVWRPEICRANTLARRGRESLPLAAAQMILALMGFGLEGRYSLKLNYPDMLFFKGSWVPCNDHVTLLHADGCLEIQTGLETYVLTDGDARLDTGLTTRQGFSEDCFYVWGYSIDPAILIAQDDPLSERRIPAACESIDAGARLVGSMGDDADAWIKRLIRVVSVVDSGRLGSNRTTSRSNAACPGNISMSAPGDALHLAELLVHEAAHQHFHLGALLESYTRPEADGQLFYSSLIGRERPLRLVALAAHAVGNIYLFLDRVASCDSDYSSEAAHRIQELGEAARSLTAQTQAQQALFTPAGGAMLFDLMEKTQAIRTKYCGSKSARPSVPAMDAHGV